MFLSFWPLKPYVLIWFVLIKKCVYYKLYKMMFFNLTKNTRILVTWKFYQIRVTWWLYQIVQKQCGVCLIQR